MQIDARAGEDLRLAIQREVVRVLRHQDMRQQPFCRQGALDQAGGRRCLGDPFLAGPAGILRPHGDDHPKLRGNDVEPLGAIFADANHLAATARAECALGLDYFLDPRQVGRQMTDVALCGRALGTWRPRRARRGLFLGLGERAFELLEGKLELVGMELLGLLPVQRPAQLVQQMFETAVAIAQRRDLGAKRLKSRLLSFEQHPQGRCKRSWIDHACARLHDRILT